MTRAVLLSLLSIVLLVALAANPTMAEDQKIATVSPSQLQSACDKAGGNYSPPTGTGEVGGAYGCSKANCDGKGGTCVVSCSGYGDCYGSTPLQLTGNQTLLSVLQNGDAVFHQLDLTPTGSLAGGGDDGVAPPPYDFE